MAQGFIQHEGAGYISTVLRLALLVLVRFFSRGPNLIGLQHDIGYVQQNRPATKVTPSKLPGFLKEPVEAQEVTESKPTGKPEDF